MKHLAVLLLVAAACGGSSPKTETAGGSAAAEDTGPVVGPPDVPWDKLTHDQQARFMAKVVMPKFKPMFQQFDAKLFADFKCKTCHGKGAADHTFKMPNPDIYVLPEAPADFQKLAQDKPEFMKFMPEVSHAMAETLGMKPFDPAAPDPSQFGCGGCHTHKPGGQDAK
jgi:hypothetical protein